MNLPAGIPRLTEQAILRNLNKTLKGKTAVLISHRLSALKDADLILFLDGGRLAEAGTHAELMERRGLYYSAWMLQAREAGGTA